MNEPVRSCALCDYWLPSRAKCGEPATGSVRNQFGAEYLFCPKHREGIALQYGFMWWETEKSLPASADRAPLAETKQGTIARKHPSAEQMLAHLKGKKDA